MNTLTNSKYTILVVGDDVDANTTVVFLLEFDGHSVTTASSGEAALAMLGKLKFDLILSEYWLPLMKGDEFAALVKEQWPDQRIIMATAYFEGSNIEEASSIVVDCLLRKPFSMQQLREAILWVFEGSSETRLNLMAAPGLSATPVAKPGV